MPRVLRARWPLFLAVAGVALVAVGAALALTSGDGRRPGPTGAIQVGGLEPRDAIRAASTPVLAVDPSNEKRVLLANRIERPRFGCDVFHSSDAGETWRRSTVVLPDVGERCYAPVVAFDGSGRTTLFLQMLAGPGNHPVAGYVYRSTDGGLSFRQPKRVLPRSGFGATMAVSRDGSIAVASLRANEFSSHVNLALGPPPNPLAVRVSRTGGRSFGPSRVVHSPRRERVGGPVLAWGPRGELYVLFWDWRDDVFDYHAFPGRYGGRFALVLAVSRDGGRSFREHVVERRVVPSRPFLVYLPPLPALAVDDRTGRLYVAWEDGRSGTSDVLLRRSDDGGRTWSAARVLFGERGHELLPALAAEPGGELTTSAYRLGAGNRADAVVRASDDGGETFAAPAALTPAPFDPRWAPRVPGRRDVPDLGSRIGLVTVGETRLAAWSDTRAGGEQTGKVDILVAPVPDERREARALPLAAQRLPRERSRVEGRLTAPCSSGPLVDSRATPQDLLRSFISAIDRGQLRRAYRYLDSTWRLGWPPATHPQSFRAFARQFAGVTCARIAKTQSGGEAGWWTTNAWIAVRRHREPTQLVIGTFWARSSRGRPPWSLMGYWTHTFPAGEAEALPVPLAAVARRAGPRPLGALDRSLERALEAIAVQHASPPRAARVLALVSVAMRDAAREAADPDGAVGPAADAVLAHVFPRSLTLEAPSAAARATDDTLSARVGRRSAARAVARARSDGAERPHRPARPPAGPGRWVPAGTAFVGTPLDPLAGQWRPWVLRSGSEFRAGRPPQPGDARYESEVREVYDVSRTLSPRERRLADFWSDGPGTFTPAGHWNAIALALIRTAGLDVREGSQVLAVLNMAQADAFIACWAAKYRYWTERPVTAIRRELDPAWRPYLQTPPFPSFPSGHACTSGAASEVLAHFFPRWARHVRGWAREAAASRVYGGIHFPVDSEAGLELGRKVGRAALARGRR